MLLCLAVGLGVGGYMLWSFIAQPHSAAIVDDHIIYVTEHKRSAAIAFSYLAATSLPLFLSSQRMMLTLGVIILVGSGAAYLLYWEAFVSVWCFFAAAASIVILGHFEWSRRHRRRMVSA